jgi:hypothetical protein
MMRNWRTARGSWREMLALFETPSNLETRDK